MKDKVNFLAKFLILTIVLFIIWIPVGKVYLLLLVVVSKYVLLVMGYNAGLVVENGVPMLFVYHGHVAVLDNAHLMNFNIIPLVALILATPRIETARRIAMLAIGVFGGRRGGGSVRVVVCAGAQGDTWKRVELWCAIST
jgi:hypothetical protein